ncbi:MAG: DUF1841 family protein [Gammaproteobacteria bacterium]|nr:DUF1841 family protein [Gammaproteobacteria bacterium]
MFGDNRGEIRKVFTEAWRKQQAGDAMSPLEQLVAAVVARHPEYHRFIENPRLSLERDFLPEGGETNPFLHLGMHISLQEQFSTDRPAGISLLYRQLTLRLGDAHGAEHQIMECLGQMLWEAQRDNRMPDEQAYLECVRRVVGG